MKRPLRYIKVKNLVAEQLILHDSIHVLKFSKKGNTWKNKYKRRVNNALPNSE